MRKTSEKQLERKGRRGEGERECESWRSRKGKVECAKK